MLVHILDMLLPLTIVVASSNKKEERVTLLARLYSLSVSSLSW